MQLWVFFKTVFIFSRIWCCLNELTAPLALALGLCALFLMFSARANVMQYKTENKKRRTKRKKWANGIKRKCSLSSCLSLFPPQSRLPPFGAQLSSRVWSPCSLPFSSILFASSCTFSCCTVWRNYNWSEVMNEFQFPILARPVWVWAALFLPSAFRLPP